MIILHTGQDEYINQYGDGHKVLDWREFDQEKRKSVVMRAGREPSKFPAVLDHRTGALLEAVTVSPEDAFAEYKNAVQEREQKRARKAQAKESIKKAEVDGQGNLQQRIEKLEEIVADLVELI